jgi:hypothetical protein
MAYVLLFDGPRAGEVVNVGNLREYHVVPMRPLKFRSLEEESTPAALCIPTVIYRPALVNPDGTGLSIWSVSGKSGAEEIFNLLIPILRSIRTERERILEWE